MSSSSFPTTEKPSSMFGWDADTQLVTILSRQYPIRHLIRLTLVIFGYLLIRPMLLRFANKIQQNEHERQERLSKEQAEKDALEGKAEDGVEIVDEEVETTGWGAGVRRRQKLEQARLKRLADQEAEAGDMGEDKELEGLLED